MSKFKFEEARCGFKKGSIIEPHELREGIFRTLIDFKVLVPVESDDDKLDPVPAKPKRKPRGKPAGSKSAPANKRDGSGSNDSGPDSSSD